MRVTAFAAPIAAAGAVAALVAWRRRYRPTPYPSSGDVPLYQWRRR